MHLFEKQILRFLPLGSLLIKPSVLRVSLGGALQVPEARQLWHLRADGFREWKALQTEMTNEITLQLKPKLMLKIKRPL